jgi:two-component sensor histidine kinase
MKAPGFLKLRKKAAWLERELAAEREARARSEAFISETLEERNILMGEIHHRVKNNLQIIISLLRLQGGGAAQEATREALARAVDRVQAISMAHERLYKSSDFSSADISAYLRDLLNSLSSALRAEGGEGVEFVLEAEPLPLDPDRCIDCGLIVNELVTNAVKHAFPGDVCADASKRVTVCFSRQGDDYLLSVSDNGVGMPGPMTAGKTGSLGIRMVNSLVRQLKGRLELGPGPGTSISVRFKAESPEGRRDRAPALQRIRRAIDSLPAEDRTLAAQYYMEGRGAADIARAMGLDLDVLMERLRSMRVAIRDSLVSSGQASSAKGGGGGAP